MAKRPVNDNHPTSVNDNDTSPATSLVPANDGANDGANEAGSTASPPATSLVPANDGANEAGSTASRKSVNEAALASMAASLAYATFSVSNFVADNDEESTKRLGELDEARKAANREAGLARMRENNRRMKEAAIARRTSPDQMNLFDKPENDK